MDKVILTTLKQIYTPKGDVFHGMKKVILGMMVLEKLIFQKLIRVKLKVGKNILK